MAYQDLVSEVLRLREQGLTDNLIIDELGKKGYAPNKVEAALAQADSPPDEEAAYAPTSFPAAPPPERPAAGEGDVYERIEEIAESLIDEKWDELIVEVKKIADWKEKTEEKQRRLESDLAKLKEDFKTLHQGVLGKLEDYDARMREVGTELKAVGKVFKDVVPQFVENVKELSSLTQKVKGR